MHIDHDGADFPYEQLSAILRERITSGEYEPGGRLPSIADIVAETGLSPMTIRRSLKVLAVEGCLRIVPGRGTFAIR